MKNGSRSATTLPRGTALSFVISTGEVMGLRPTQGDKERVLFGNHTQWKRRPPLCHLDRSEAQWRDLRFSGPFLEMCSSLLAATDHVWVFIGNPGERSGRTCGVCVKSPLNSQSAYPIEPRSVRSEFSLQRSNRPQIFTLPQITHCVVTLGQSQVRPAVTHLPRLITQIEDR
jgi:hypothetical protein